ncbi:MAG TPA: response regulator [Cytophagaceae bacterium]|jgi:CheY-like chemotaxis protein|nr:response regulator [Cytophagaceae bacterium]
MRKINCVLVIDDSEMDRWLALKILEQADINSSAITASNGQEALKKLTEYLEENNCLPELILVDLQMPLMNGFEFIKKIKMLSHYPESKTQIILLTAGLDSEIDLPKIEENEIKHILFKPLNKEELLNMIDLSFKEKR